MEAFSIYIVLVHYAPLQVKWHYYNISGNKIERREENSPTGCVGVYYLPLEFDKGGEAGPLNPP